MKAKIAMPLYQLAGFTFSVFGVGFASGLAIASPAHSILPVAITVVGLAITSVGFAVALKGATA
ncbi:hypothetical protein QZM64_39705 [Burkholderia cepacia]|uniref:hypothetical protein n=1 Tax=Burkholderia cepacia complex TaxID=87882 RepID=UPI000CFF5865|nr:MULTISPECIES: hypothetical protein [Burkholderia cepacia complex]MDN7445298.1 hypothetical protein [Burkholderia cepacia]